MNLAAISTNSVARSNRDGNLLLFRYKLAKLLRLVPHRERKEASDFEECNFPGHFYGELWSGAAERLGYSYRDLGYGFWAVSDGNGTEVRGRVGILPIDSSITLKLAGNKPLTHRLLESIPGYCRPAYCEFRLDSIHRALSFLQDRSGPCVVKPARDTGAGAGVVMGVDDAVSLRSAAITSSMQCKDLLIEETIAGSSYRLLFLDGEYLHGVRRDPPQVVGDGRSTVGELIAAENRRRKTQGRNIQSLFLLHIDQDCRAALQDQSLTLNTRPYEGQKVLVKRVVNQNAARENVVVTDAVHSDIVKIGAMASRKLGLHLSGVDVLTTDITRPLEESGGVINEINSCPGLHHHYLNASNEDPHLAERLLRYCMARASAPGALE